MPGISSLRDAAANEQIGQPIEGGSGGIVGLHAFFAYLVQRRVQFLVPAIELIHGESKDDNDRAGETEPQQHVRN